MVFCFYIIFVLFIGGAAGGGYAQVIPMEEVYTRTSEYFLMQGEKFVLMMNAICLTATLVSL